MNILVFAHRGEAQEFIPYFKFKIVEFPIEGLYRSDDCFLLICGEGELNVFTKLGAVLGAYREITNVINLGIAGSLNSKIENNSMITVRTCLGFKQEHQFQSVPTSNNVGIDIVSVSERILSDEFANKIRPIADVVDREAWSVALVAKRMKLSVGCYKYISDQAGSQIKCFDLKERALFFSTKLLEFYLSLADKEITVNLKQMEYINHPLLHISFTQKNDLNKLINCVAINEDIPGEQVWKNIDFDKYESINAPKARTKALLQDLYYQINPLMKVVDENLAAVTKGLTTVGANISFDSKMEREGFRLSMDINSQSNVVRLKQSLDVFDYEKIRQIFKGEVDV